jgi:O-methyltransferase involved in polyketide biosynthesis
MRDSGYVTPATISPTAHYTGFVWARHGLSHPALVTAEGRALFHLLRPAAAIGGALGAPYIESVLMTRHRLIDLKLSEAIESGRITQVVEIAAGLSPRGWQFSQRYADRLTYIEADLPGMTLRKREALARIGPLAPNHRVVDLDALADDGPESLAALVATLDATQGVAIVTEGLLNYFNEDVVRGIWQRFARALVRFPLGVYWSDLHLSSETRGPGVGTFVKLLSIFVKGRVSLHFTSAEQASAALRESGFTAASLLDPRDFSAQLGDIPNGVSRHVRIIEARATGQA